MEINMDQPSTEPVAPSPPLLKLFGSWASGYTHRVQLALKLKGLEYEYVEEDFTNKSPSLLQVLNSSQVDIKDPVLVHDDKPVVDSAIILQYIDETWSTGNRLLPEDPYERALMRFWAHFAEDKLGPSIGVAFRSVGGEEQKAAVEQVQNHLKILEGELENGFFKGKPFFGGDKLGFLDIILGCGSYWLTVFEEVAKLELVDKEKCPKFESWLRAFEEQNEVKEAVPDTGKLVEHAKNLLTQANP